MTSPSRVALTVMLAGALVLVGCAKRPNVTIAASPAPTGVAATTPTSPAAPEPAQPSQAEQPAAASPAERPEPKEFVSVPELRDIRFDFDKYDIRSGDARVLDANAQWRLDHRDQLLLIEGHCDERGTNGYNLALGERRACPEHTEECWAQNRRAHVLVKPR